MSRPYYNKTRDEQKDRTYLKDFTPKSYLDGKYTEIIIQTNVCNYCDNVMIPERAMSLFPMWHEANGKSQCGRGNLVIEDMKSSSDDRICVDCYKANKKVFKCYSCFRSQEMDQVYQDFYHEEYLCKSCYASVPAKDWDKYIDEINENHKYD